MNMASKTLLAAMCVFSMSASEAQSLLDEWWTPGFSARVKLQPCGAELCGTIVWAWDDQPAGASDKRGLVGQRIIIGMKSDAPVNGKPPRHSGSIYNPEDGQTYKATLQLKTANTVIVNGCVLFICREQIWRRYDSLKTPPVAALP